VTAFQGKRKWRVAVVLNIKDESIFLAPGLPPDAFGDFDSRETVRTIQNAIETDGHETRLLLADKTLPKALEEYQPDICSNDAEGTQGDAREAQTPAMLEMLNFPYTGSRILTNAIALDKTMTKRIWRDHGLPVAPFQEISTGEETVSPALNFPLFVKPAREGSGMGIDENSIVHSEKNCRGASNTSLRSINNLPW